MVYTFTLAEYYYLLLFVPATCFFLFFFSKDWLLTFFREINRMYICVINFIICCSYTVVVGPRTQTTVSLNGFSLYALQKKTLLHVKILANIKCTYLAARTPIIMRDKKDPISTVACIKMSQEQMRILGRKMISYIL